MEALFCKQLFLEATSVIIKFLWGGELYNSTWSAVEVIKTEPLVFLCVTLWALSRQTHECIFRAHHPHSIKPCKVRFWVSLYSSLWYSVCDNFLPPKFLFIYSKTDIWLVHLWVVAGGATAPALSGVFILYQDWHLKNHSKSSHCCQKIKSLIIFP